MDVSFSGDADRPRDALTGLAGTEAARERLGQWLAQAAAVGHPARIHALSLGLRRFDAVNMAFGAAAGDLALAEVAGRLTHFAGAELDGPWLAARGSGSNFLLIANEACSRERWQFLAGQIADAVARPFATPAGMLRLSPRLAMLRALPGETPDSIVDRLGQALATAKRQQGRRCVWAPGESAPLGLTAARLEADLLAAIDRDEIEVLFQPQFALPDDTLSGAEALARWQHPQLGRIGAGTLFAIAERADHVAQLSRHIAERALGLASGWPAGLRLSLNVTPSDMAAGSYVDDLLRLVEQSGFAPGDLTLEVTEQVLLHDVASAGAMFQALASEGVRIALDDFGAGFCNFRYLKLLPLHYLKLDRSMVEGIPGDARDLAVLRGILAMARALDLSVIAEGIETEQQRDAISREGCSFYQGFLRAAPMDAQTLTSAMLQPFAQ
jgi:predicted signal transduction protein with EAL and GGDEF domain